MKKKLIIVLITFMTLPFLFGSTSYNYSYHGDAIHSSPGMNFASYLNPQILGVQYSDPKDLVVYEDKIYLIATNRREGTTGSVIIVLDENFELIETVETFELTNDYHLKVESQVSETIEAINEYYIDYFANNVIYSGITIPMAQNPFTTMVDEMVWTSSLPGVITTTGITKNNTEEPIAVDLTVEISLWSEVRTFEFQATVSPEVNGLSATSESNPTYTVDKEFSIERLNEILKIELDDLSYNSIRDIVDINRIDAEITGEFEFQGFKFTYVEDFIKVEDSDEEVLDYTKITIQKIIDSEFEGPAAVHSSLFESPYILRGSSGIDVKSSGIYIADTNNNRVLKLTHDYKVVDAFYDIEDETFNEIAFHPLKITVDPSERMYVVANNVYEGILELDFDGTFNRYTGVNPIELTAFEILRRALMTEVQKAKLDRFLPTSYTNVTLNDRNFLYATAQSRDESTSNMIQLINPKGIDVLKRNGYHPPMGDVIYVQTRDNYVIDGPSSLVDIAVGKHGIYSVLDEKRSRIFTYDSEGNLLYINGDEGQQSDKFSRGVAIAYHGDNLMVLDASGTIIIYSPTEFGSSVNKAVELHSIGQFEEAALLWEDVLRLNTNYEVAYNGIGKYHLRAGNYKEAMENFKLGHDQYYYSKAFVAYRNEILKKNFGLIMFGVLAIAIAIPVYLNREKIFKKGKGE